MDCKDESSANWLRDIAPKLVGWKGAVLYEKRRVELADEFARSATFTTMVGPETYMVVAPHTINELPRKKERLGRKRYWLQLQGMRQTKLLMVGYKLGRFKNGVG